MKTLISDIYNKILEFFQSDKNSNTSDCATNRLQVILMHDRTKLDPLIMNKMREELIDVFSKYVVIDKEQLAIDLKNEGDAVALMLNIPVVRAKTEEELNEIRKKIQEEEEKVNALEDDDDDEEEKIVEGEVTEIEDSEADDEVELENDEETTEAEEEDDDEDDVIIEEDEEEASSEEASSEEETKE